MLEMLGRSFDNLPKFRERGLNGVSHWRVNNIELEIMAGSDVQSSIADAIALATLNTSPQNEERGTSVSFNLNGVPFLVKADSDPLLLERDFYRASLGTIPGVGPYPEMELSEEQLSADRRAKADRAKRTAKVYAEANS